MTDNLRAILRDFENAALRTRRTPSQAATEVAGTTLPVAVTSTLGGAS